MYVIIMSIIPHRLTIRNHLPRPDNSKINVILYEKGLLKGIISVLFVFPPVDICLEAPDRSNTTKQMVGNSQFKYVCNQETYFPVSISKRSISTAKKRVQLANIG